MIESGIVAPGSVKAVLTGKQYNRCIRVHKIIYEAMQRLRYLAFYDSLPDHEADKLCSFGVDLLNCGYENLSGFCSDDPNFLAWKGAFDSFVKERSNKNLPLPFGQVTSIWFSCCYFLFKQQELQIGSYIYQL